MQTTHTLTLQVRLDIAYEGTEGAAALAATIAQAIAEFRQTPLAVDVDGNEIFVNAVVVEQVQE